MLLPFSFVFIELSGIIKIFSAIKTNFIKLYKNIDVIEFNLIFIFKKYSNFGFLFKRLNLIRFLK